MGLAVTVDGSWEIPDSFLVTWYNNEIRRIWDKRDVIIITRSRLKKISNLHIFVKNGL